MGKLKINGEILKYHREFQERSIYEIAKILGTGTSIIELIEDKDCEIDESEKDTIDLIDRYCAILQINSYIPYLPTIDIPNEPIRECWITNMRHNRYKLHAQKDDVEVNFEVDKKFIIDFIEDLIFELAYGD